MKDTDTYTEKTLDIPNAVVRVYVPTLSREERDRRMREIQQAAVSLIRKGRET